MKYDKESRQQLQDIEMNRRITELEKQLGALQSKVYLIDNRTGVLEGARKVQIGLNAKFAKKPKVVKKKWWFQ